MYLKAGVKYGGKEAAMVESKLTKVKVNNEIELCEVYDSATKERIKKVFFREDISFFIKFRKKSSREDFAAVKLAEERRQDDEEKKRIQSETKEGRYIICVNKSQRALAHKSIARVMPDYKERLLFLDDKGARKSDRQLFWELVTE